jgi:histidine ammonia-lyase
MKEAAAIRKVGKRFRARTFEVDGSSLALEDIARFIREPFMKVTLGPRTLKRVKESNDMLKRESAKRPIYGVNTGFGPMVTHIIGTEHMSELQYNLIRGHAVGTGAPVRRDNVLAAMMVRLNTLAKGYSGVSVELVEKLCELINHRVTPIVPEHGAVGTSGDLVQLAHIALSLIGEGDVEYKGKISPASQIFRKLRISPHVLQPKEGLSLINGTAMMSGVATRLILDAERLTDIAVRSGALALELVRAIDDLLDPVLHAARPHGGQEKVAKTLRKLLQDSSLLSDRNVRASKVDVKKSHVTDIHLQDVYSFRCIPQILGAIRDTIQNSRKVLEVEINSATDNPILDVGKNRFLHGGNFHGEYVAMAADQVKAALVKLTMLSERRINFFLNSSLNKTFPPFLNLKEPGLTMGLQGLQFVATSTTAQNQSLAFPHAIHSIPTNADNQDVVSMGCDAALIAEKVVENAYIVLAIELTTLAQATDSIKAFPKLSSASRMLYRKIRTHMKPIIHDRTLTPDLERLRAALQADTELNLP